MRRICSKCGKTYTCINLDITANGTTAYKSTTLHPCSNSKTNRLSFCRICESCNEKEGMGGSICYDLEKVKEKRPDLYTIALREMDMPPEKEIKFSLVKTLEEEI